MVPVINDHLCFRVVHKLSWIPKVYPNLNATNNFNPSNSQLKNMMSWTNAVASTVAVPIFGDNFNVLS